MIQRVAALIENNGKIMICQNAKTQLWELSGGDVAEGESHKQALLRAVRRQLGVTVTVRDAVYSEELSLCGEMLCRTVFDAFIAYGTPIRFEHSSIRWVSLSDLSDYALCPEDKRAFDKITLKKCS